MRYFLSFALLLPSLSYARYFDCKVTNYYLVGGDASSTVLHDIQRVYLFEREGNTTEEIVVGCNHRKAKSKFIQIKAVSRSQGIVELTRCETQKEDADLSEDKIIFSNYNDHDAPEESVRLFRTNRGYFGEIESNWDAKETIQMECESYLN